MICYCTAMANNSDHPFSEACSPIIIKELDALACAIAKHPNAAGKEGLAIIRVAKGLELKDWEQLSTLYDLSGWLAMPIGNAKVNAVSDMLALLENLTYLRDHDALTGVGNRRLFDTRLGVELHRANRTGADLSLAMLDIDNFKKINDTYGHNCGDIILKGLAKTLKRSVRPYDTVARVGGEEFSLILPATSIHSAFLIVDKIRKRFLQETFACNGETPVSFSAGVASVKLFSPFPAATVLQESADKAMYLAKNNGKNLVVVADTPKARLDRHSLVQADEKAFLFSSSNLNK